MSSVRTLTFLSVFAGGSSTLCSVRKLGQLFAHLQHLALNPLARSEHLTMSIGGTPAQRTQWTDSFFLLSTLYASEIVLDTLHSFVMYRCYARICYVVYCECITVVSACRLVSHAGTVVPPPL